MAKESCCGITSGRLCRLGGGLTTRDPVDTELKEGICSNDLVVYFPALLPTLTRLAQCRTRVKTLLPQSLGCQQRCRFK